MLSLFILKVFNKKSVIELTSFEDNFKYKLLLSFFSIEQQQENFFLKSFANVFNLS